MWGFDHVVEYVPDVVGCASLYRLYNELPRYYYPHLHFCYNCKDFDGRLVGLSKFAENWPKIFPCPRRLGNHIWIHPILLVFSIPFAWVDGITFLQNY